MSDLIWRRSSRCDSASCVAVAFTDDAVHVGDTKYPKAPPIIYDHDSWREMTDAIHSADTPRAAADRLADVLYLDVMGEYCWRTEEFCLHFDEREWDAFVAGCVVGEFDLPEVTHA